MADLNLRLEVRFSPGLLRWGMAALLLSVMAQELATESVTLSTYYPAPSGVYTNMITTGNTFLARNAGSRVGIGTTNPGEELHVNGQVIAGSASGSAPGGEPFSSVGASSGISLDDRSGGANPRWVLYPSGSRLRVWNGTDGDLLAFEVGGNIGVGLTNPVAPLHIRRTTLGGGFIALEDQGCTQTFYDTGTDSCPAGRYVTLAAGIFTERWELGLRPDFFNRGYMLCCPCQSSPCPSL